MFGKEEKRKRKEKSFGIFHNKAFFSDFFLNGWGGQGIFFEILEFFEMFENFQTFVSVIFYVFWVFFIIEIF